MRIVFGALSLLIVLAIVGVLAKKQLTAIAPAAPSNAPAGTVAAPSGTPQQQVQQVQQAVQSAVQQPRPVPDESK